MLRTTRSVKPVKLTRNGKSRGYHTANVTLASKMFKHQDQLPRFPVPKLEDTLAKFKDVIRPLLPAEEYQRYMKTVDDFGRTEGPELQRLLLELEKESPFNWMEGYWQSMYLDLRCPMPIHVNPYLVVGDDPNPVRNTSQTLKAANLIAAAARFAAKAFAEDIDPDMDKTTPLCMNGFTRIFGTRVPRFGRDYFFVADKPRHVVIVSFGQYYRVDVINTDGSFVSEQEIARQIEAVKLHSRDRRLTETSIFPIGILTTEDRDIWASAKQQLEGVNAVNKNNLTDIDSAILVVCLDETTPKDMAEFSKTAFYETNGNRYYDKLALIISQNGMAAYNMEHTGYDGQVLYRFMYDTYNDAVKAPAITLNTSNLPTPKHLPFTLSQPIKTAISSASAKFNDFVATTQLEVYNFTDFGKEKIKKYNCSPDAFFQISAQVANFRTMGKVTATYESSSVRNFSHGRTETIRSLTNEVNDFVKKFHDKSAGAKDKFDSFHKAATRHVEQVKNSKIGKGQDRHLQGLYWTALQKRWRIDQYSIPKFFTENGNYSNFMSNRLSTSNVGGGFAGVTSFGFGPVHGEGIGLGYMINDNSLPMTISSFQGKATTFKNHMGNALNEISAFLENHKQ